MKDVFCDQEAAVLEAVESGRWPHASGPDLLLHVSRCSICADVLLVAQTLQQENHRAQAELVLPAAGLVWWKAQMRARREATERAAEPIALVEKAAGIFGILSLVALAIWRWDLVADWLAWVADLPRSATFRPDSLWNSSIFATTQNFGFLMFLSAATCVVLASVVLYFTFSKD